MSLINQFIKSWFAGYLRSPNHRRGDICSIVYSLWHKKCYKEIAATCWNKPGRLEGLVLTHGGSQRPLASVVPICARCVLPPWFRAGGELLPPSSSDRKSSWTFNFMRQLLDRPASNCYWSSLFLPHVCYYAKLDDFAPCKKIHQLHSPLCKRPVHLGDP